jgi:hypothetical protein
VTCLTPLQGLHGHFGSASIAPCGLAQLIKFPTLSEFYEEVAPWPIVKVPRAAQAADRVEVKVEVRGILAGSERAEVAANKVEVDQEVAKAVRVEVGRAAVAGKAAVAARVDQEAVKRVVVVREVQGEAKAGRAEGVGKAGRGARTARL